MTKEGTQQEERLEEMKRLKQGQRQTFFVRCPKCREIVYVGRDKLIDKCVKLSEDTRIHSFKEKGGNR